MMALSFAIASSAELAATTRKIVRPTTIISFLKCELPSISHLLLRKGQRIVGCPAVDLAKDQKNVNPALFGPGAVKITGHCPSLTHGFCVKLCLSPTRQGLTRL